MSTRRQAATVSRRRLLAAFGVTALAGSVGGGMVIASRTSTTGPPEPMPRASLGPPTIYSTDLSHPHIDADDHFDLAVAHGLNLDVRAIVLDRHAIVGSVPGLGPVSQMNAITGRSWPAEDGLPHALRTLQDRGYHQGDHRDAATAVLDVLRAAERRTAVVIMGSCRDVAAAYNTAPGLFHDRLERLVIFAGDASLTGFVENNVGLDPLAFLRLMGSGLPIRWVPCFDGGPWQAGSRSSFVQTPQANLFPADLPAPVLRYFSYMLHDATSDPIAYLSQPVTDEDRTLLSTGSRNLWVGPLVGAARGNGSVQWQGTTVAVFEPIEVRFALSGALDPTGRVTARVDCWRVVDPPGWQQAMVARTVDALRRIPIAVSASGSQQI